MAGPASALAAVCAFTILSFQPVAAVGPESLSDSLAASLNPPVAPLGPSSPSVSSTEGAASVCAIHTWLDPTGGVVRVRMIHASTVITSPTWVGVLAFNSGDIAHAYCTDIAHHAAGNRPYCLDPGFFSDWRVAWFVSVYPPTPDDRVQQAARQAALWHLTDGAILDAANATLGDATLDAAVLNAYHALLASIPASPPPSFHPGNMELAVTPGSALNLLPGGETHTFTVRLTKGGLPLAGYAVQVTATLGALSSLDGVTDDNGEARFTLTSAISGTAFITATAQVTLPAGSRFLDQMEPAAKQRLVLAQNKPVLIQGFGNKTWLTAPNSIVVRKFSDRNGNGLQESNEPNLAGWRFVLNMPNGSAFTRTTGADGNAYFDNLVPDALYGVFTITEILQPGWINTTPLVVTRARSPQDAWTQWAVSYGNAQLAQLKVHKFLDLNLNGQRDPGEPGLAGWQFEVRRWDGNDFIAFLGGATDGTGHVRFNNLAPGLYKIIELSQTGYTHTTPLEQIVEILPGSSGVYEVRFGNARTGSLVVVKAVDWNGASPDPAQTFTLCVAGPSWPAGNCQTIGAEGGSLIWTSLLPGVYTITETEPGPAWSVAGSGVSVTLSGGGGLFTGTITNTRNTPQLGRLIVTKTVDWIGATPDAGQTFEICVSGPSWPDGNCQTIGAAGGALTWDNLLPGVYTVTETSPGSAWSVSGSGVAVMAPPNGAGSAILTNTLRFGSLIITKTVDWGAFTPDPGLSFTLCISGPSYPVTPDCQSASSGGGTLVWNALIPGDYSVSEPNTGNLWHVTISDAIVTVRGGSAAGAEVLNRYIGGRLVVTKTVDWNGVPVSLDQTFELCVTGPSHPAGNCQTVGPNGGSAVWDNLIAGVYTVTETGPGPAWHVIGDNVTVTVPEGSSGATTITNTRQTPGLLIRKSSIPSNGTQVARGSLITYVLALTNTGQIALTGVRLTDTVPPGTEYITGSAVPDPAGAPSPLVWVVPMLNVGEVFTARFTVRVAPVTGALAITNSASVSSDQTPVTQSSVIVHPFRETAIDLLSFTATPQANNTILVRWVTGAEINTFGFHLFRSANGSRDTATRVTDQIILSQGWGQGGATYQWIDAHVQPGVIWTYWLQEIELDGRALEYGPVSASLDPPGLVRRAYLPIASR